MADTLLQYAMAVPNAKRRGVVKIFAETSRIAQMLNFIDIGDSMVYEYNVETGLPNVGFRALNDDFSHAEGNYVLAPRTEGTAIMGGVVKTDRQMLARKPACVSAKTRSAALYFDRQFFDGDTEANPEGFDGVNKRLGSGNQVIAAGANGGYLDLDKLSELIDKVIGGDDQKRLLMSSDMRRTLGATLRAEGGTTIGLSEWAGPLKPTSFDNVRIELIGEDETGAEILGFDETQGSYKTAGSIYCANFGATDDEDRLQGLAKAAGEGFLEVEDQGVSGSTDKTLVEGRLGLAIFHGRSIARYRGIKEGVSAA